MSWLWTPALVGTSCTGVWLAARHWYGWAISAASEGLWLAYSLVTRDTPLAVMSVLWFFIHARNTWRCRDDLRRQRMAH